MVETRKLIRELMVIVNREHGTIPEEIKQLLMLSTDELEAVENKVKQHENEIKFANEILEFCKAGDYNCDLLEATEMLYTELFALDDAELNENKLIQVCSSCKRACCWCGEFVCEDNLSAGTELKTVKELRELNKHENKDYWGGEYMKKVYGDPNPFGVIENEDNQKIKELNQHCGECAIIDYCAEPFEELCLCTDERFENLTENEYIELALKSHEGENDKIAEDVAQMLLIERG